MPCKEFRIVVFCDHTNNRKCQKGGGWLSNDISQTKESLK